MPNATLQQSTQMIPLKSLKAGEWGTVVELIGSECTVKCLAEIGLRVGSRLKIVVPGPSAVCQVGDVTLSLRVCRHCDVFVRLDD